MLFFLIVSFFFSFSYRVTDCKTQFEIKEIFLKINKLVNYYLLFRLSLFEFVFFSVLIDNFVIIIMTWAGVGGQKHSHTRNNVCVGVGGGKERKEGWW